MDGPFIIIKDAISKNYENEIHSIFNGRNSVPWHLDHETTQEGKDIEITSVMYHMAFYHKYGGVTSDVFDRVKPALWQIIEKAGLPFREFLQIRAIIQFPVITSRTHNFIHTDLEERNHPQLTYYTGVYYVHGDTDGETVLFDEMAYDIPFQQVQSHYKEFKEIGRVFPEKGKAVMFSGQRYHCSTLPTKKTRTILNFSWC